MSDFYNKYPYTDFHELNLDWVIERVKKLTEDWLATQQEWNDTEEQWQQLHDYVMNYFANLDVQDEINNKINSMISDGTFATIITPIVNAQVADTVATWLAEHITPTTPVVDNTLTISGAAADSKTVGDLCFRGSTITVSGSNVSSYDDLDNYPKDVLIGISGTIATSANIAHLPLENQTLYVITLSYMNSVTTGVQIAWSGDSKMFYRMKTDAWYSWKQVNTMDNADLFQSGNIYVESYNVSSYSDMDDYPKNKMIGVSGAIATSANIAHLPVENTTFYTVYFISNQNDSIGVQLAWDVGKRMYYRTHHISLGWSDWSMSINDTIFGHAYKSSNITVTSSNVSSYSNLDNYPTNILIGISGTVATSANISNLPMQGQTLFVISMSYLHSGMTGVQIAWSGTSKMFYRIKTGSWESWIEITNTTDINTFMSGNVYVSGSNVSSYSDMDNYPRNRFICISGGIATSTYIAHLPVENSTLFTMYCISNQNDSLGVQLAWDITNKGMYYRTHHASLGWSEWTSVQSVSEYTDTYYPLHTSVDKSFNFTNKGMYIFGDSFTTTSHGGFTWGSILATKLSNTEYNYGVSGAGFYFNTYGTIQHQIDGVSDWSNADIVFICGGINDVANNVSSSNFKTAVTNAIDTVKTNAPNAKIILISPTHLDQTVDGRIRPYSSAMCNIALGKECCFINGFDFPIAVKTNDWVDNQTDNDGLHPNATGKKIYAQCIINAIM